MNRVVIGALAVSLLLTVVYVAGSIYNMTKKLNLSSKEDWHRCADPPFIYRFLITSTLVTTPCFTLSTLSAQSW